MNVLTLAIFFLIRTAYSNRPHLSLMIKDGSFANIWGLDPSVTWSGSRSSGDIDFKYGIDTVLIPTNDITSLPRSIWGKASTNVGSWDVSVSAEFPGADFHNAEVDINAVNDDISLHLEASTGNGSKVHRVEATKSFDEDGSCVTINPRYNFDNNKSDIVLGLSKRGTDIRFTASHEEQYISLSHRLDKDNRISPSIASNGNLSLEWERRLVNGNSLTTIFKPNVSIDVEWKDSSWIADINFPIDGTKIKGANVRVKKEVNF